MSLTTVDQLWPDVVAATRRLDSAPFRHVVDALVSDGSAPGSDPLRRWNELAQTVSDEVGELTAAEWSDQAAQALDGLLGSLDPNDTIAAATVLTFSYYEAVVIWEHSDNHTALDAVITQTVRRCEAARSNRADQGELLSAIAAAASALSTQLEVESAWLCGSSTAIGSAARRAGAALDHAAEMLDLVPTHDDHAAAGTPVPHLLRVLAETIEDARIYFGLLADHVAPAARAFELNLAGREADHRVRELLRSAARAVDSALADDGHPPTLIGVFRSEARAQARALRGMMSVVAADDSQPSLLLDSATIEFVYPFRLPFDGDGETESYLAGRFRSASAPTIAGCEVLVEKRLQTSTTAKAADMIDRGAHGSSTRLLLESSALVLQTADGNRWCGVGVEVVLGSLGNHFLRFSVTTDTPVRRHEPGRGWVPSSTAGWTPYELDLMLHRGGSDFGDELVGFLDRDDLNGDVESEQTPWASILDLAVSMIEELYLVANEPTYHSGGSSRSVTAADSTGEVIDKAVRHQLRAMVRQQGHIVVTVAEARAVGPEGTSPLTSADQLLLVAGGSLLLANQPPLPRAIDEWTCAPPVTALPPGLVGSMDSFATCNGDTTLLFVPYSPNWQVIEDKELLLFALSLGSAYIGNRERLHELMQEALQLTTPEDLTLHQRDQIEAFAAVVNTTEEELTSSTAFADRLIDHARGAVVIRPRRDRMLLDHVMERSGVMDLHADLLATRQTAAARIADLRDTASKIRDARRRRGEVLVERLLLAVAVLAFVDLFWWYFDTHRDPISRGWTIYFWAVTGLLVAAFLVLAAVVLRHATRSNRGSTSSMDPAGSDRGGSTLDHHG